MATGRKTVVVGQVIDPVAWGNPLWDQSIQWFLSAADRDAQMPAPQRGAAAFLENTRQVTIYTGYRWLVLGGPWAGSSGAAVAVPASGVTNVTFTFPQFWFRQVPIVVATATNSLVICGIGAATINDVVVTMRNTTAGATTSSVQILAMEPSPTS